MGLLQMNQLIEQGISYAKADGGKASVVRIENERRIGDGIYGVAYYADILFHGRQKRFVIKRFKDLRKEFEKRSAEENASRAINNYQRAKKAGLRVLTTYRSGEDGASILMTNATTESVMCIGSDTLAYFGEQKLSSLNPENFQTLANDIFQQGIIATNYNTYVHWDSYFYSINRQTRAVDFVMGDYDMVIENSKRTHILLHSNLNQASNSLTNFLNRNVTDPMRYIPFVGETHELLIAGNR